MIGGIALVVGGYAVFYWGLHHFKGVDCPENDPTHCRHSLFTLLGLKNFSLVGKPQGQQLAAVSSFENTDNQTQATTGSNSSSSGGLIQTSGSSWQTNILTGLNAPTDQNSINKMTAWNACEGNDAGKSGLGINNPFNTTLDYGGGVSVNSAGVKSYPTLAIGIQATLQTLQASRYSAVVQNLQKGGTNGAFANAVGSSGWGTSGSCISNALNAGVTAV